MAGKKQVVIAHPPGPDLGHAGPTCQRLDRQQPAVAKHPVLRRQDQGAVVVQDTRRQPHRPCPAARDLLRAHPEQGLRPMVGRVDQIARPQRLDRAPARGRGDHRPGGEADGQAGIGGGGRTVARDQAIGDLALDRPRGRDALHRAASKLQRIDRHVLAGVRRADGAQDVGIFVLDIDPRRPGRAVEGDGVGQGLVGVLERGGAGVGVVDAQLAPPRPGRQAQRRDPDGRAIGRDMTREGIGPGGDQIAQGQGMDGPERHSSPAVAARPRPACGDCAFLSRPRQRPAGHAADRFQ